MVNKILNQLRQSDPDIDWSKINKALLFAEGKDEHISKILESVLPLHPDQDTILTLLIQDIYINGLISDEEVKKHFGASVSQMVATIKKLKSVSYIDNDRTSQLEVLRKMFMAMAKDIRVIIVCLAYRLYKLENFDGDEVSREFFAKETLALYVPIAERLGIYSIKLQLEDAAFHYSNPADYNYIVKQLTKLRNSCDVSISLVQKKLKKFFESKGMELEIYGRVKSIYSIYKKLRKKGLEKVSDLYDVFAMRIIAPVKKDEQGNEGVDHLYGILGILHSEWRPVSKRFKDYIAVPKPNGYRSLHTVVLGLAPKDMEQPIEIQIRDENMHRESEYGVASHWLYHQGRTNVDSVRTQIDWIKGLESIRESFDDEDVLHEVGVDIFHDRIFVLTPRGEVRDLPVGSTPIDFAYSVHTDVGNKCVMAKVDSRVVPLDYELQNGEVVQILTKKDAKPKLQWLSMVRTGFAKSRIKAWFSSQNKEHHVKEGKRLLNNQLSRIGKSKLDNKYTLLKSYLGQELSIAQRESLLEEIGTGAKLASDVVRKIYPYEDFLAEKFAEEKIVERDFAGISQKMLIEDQVLIGGETGLPIKIAACCKPKFGENILGYVTRGNRVTIHKSVCPLVDALDAERIVFAGWKGNESADGRKYRVGIKVLCVSRVGLIKDITLVISEMNINIVDVRIRKSSGGLFEDCFLLDLNTVDQFDLLVDKIEKIKGVVKVTREEKFETMVG